MAKLNQLIAAIKTIKDRSKQQVTEAYHLVQTQTLFKGLSRTFQPRDEDGYVYPSEHQKIQLTGDAVISSFTLALKEVIDACATQDYANTLARADVVVDGAVVLSDVPITTLLALKTRLEDIRTFINALPILDPDQEWAFDDARGCYVTKPKQTTKTKKIAKPMILYEATKEHPAQVKEVSDDIVEGTWSLVNFSGALPLSQIREMRRRCDMLLQAVLAAKEEANEREIVQQAIAQKIFGFIFG